MCRYIYIHTYKVAVLQLMCFAECDDSLGEIKCTSTLSSQLLYAT